MNINRLKDLPVIDRIVWAIFVIFMFSVICFGDNAQMYIITNGLFLFLLMLMLLRLLPLEPVNKNVFMFTPFFLFAALSYLWSYAPDASAVRISTMLKLWIMLIITAIYLIKTRSSVAFAQGIAVASVFVLIYVLSFYGISGLRTLMRESVRVGTEIVNANTLAVFLATNASYFFLKMLQKKSGFYLGLTIVYIAIVALTGSKKGIIDLIIGFMIVITFSNEKKGGKTIRVLWAICILFTIMYFLKDVPVFGLVVERFEGMLGKGAKIDFSTMERKKLLLAGFQQFFKTPILGIGVGAAEYISMRVVGYSTYLHSNPVELLATLGLTGFLFYYLSVTKLIRKIFKVIQKDREGLFIFIFLVVGMVNSMFSVEYFSKLTYMEFAIAISYYVDSIECDI